MGRWRPSAVDVSFGVPGLGFSGTWEPDDAERAASWELLVELSTRVSIAGIDANGSLRGALTSLYGLFDTTRVILRTHGPSVARSSGSGNLSFGVIAVRVLNDVLRPLLNEWNERLATWENARDPDVSPVDHERAWADYDACRDAVERVIPVVRQYVLVLAEAADAHELATAVIVPGESQGSDANDPGLRDLSRSQQGRLGFRPRHRMVRWFDPGVLIGSARRILERRGATTDPRESMPVGGAVAVPRTHQDEVWFDYVADLGDAFDPTMAVAWHLGRARLPTEQFALGERVGDLPRGGLPRGAFLVMGGDEIYPYPTADGYRSQTTGPYSLALADDDPSTLLAIPGNHDWYDGLDAFTTTFCTKAAHGGWHTVQDASWFATPLPHGWWLWGLDTGLTGDLNDRQRQYFADVATSLRPGDRVIVASPVPAWRLREKRSSPTHDDEWGQITSLLADVLPDGVDVPLFLAGDTHVYAHYVQSPDGSGGRQVHHVTSGGGGAFLHPTHNLAPRVPQSSNEPDSFRLEGAWPPRPISRHTLAGSTRRLAFDRQSLPLIGLLAVLHAGFQVAAGAGMRDELASESGSLIDDASALGERVATDPVTWVLSLVVVLVCALVIPRPNVADPLVRRAARRLGTVHGAAQAATFVLATVAGGLVSRAIGGDDVGTPAVVAGTMIGALVGALAGVTIFAHYLRTVNQRYRIHDNEAFSGRHHRGYKHFVRGHIDDHGTLRLYVVGLGTVRAGWGAALADGAPPPTTPLTLVDLVEIGCGGRR